MKITLIDRINTLKIEFLHRYTEDAKEKSKETLIVTIDTSNYLGAYSYDDKKNIHNITLSQNLLSIQNGHTEQTIIHELTHMFYQIAINGGYLAKHQPSNFKQIKDFMEKGDNGAVTSEIMATINGMFFNEIVEMKDEIINNYFD